MGVSSVTQEQFSSSLDGLLVEVGIKEEKPPFHAAIMNYSLGNLNGLSFMEIDLLEEAIAFLKQIEIRYNNI